MYQKPHLHVLNWVTLLKFGLEVSTCAAVKPASLAHEYSLTTRGLWAELLVEY